MVGWRFHLWKVSLRPSVLCLQQRSPPAFGFSNRHLLLKFTELCCCCCFRPSEQRTAPTVTGSRSRKKRTRGRKRRTNGSTKRVKVERSKKNMKQKVGVPPKRSSGLASAKSLSDQHHQLLLALVDLFQVVYELGKLDVSVLSKQERLARFAQELDEFPVVSRAYVR